MSVDSFVYLFRLLQYFISFKSIVSVILDLQDFGFLKQMVKSIWQHVMVLSSVLWHLFAVGFTDIGSLYLARRNWEGLPYYGYGVRVELHIQTIGTLMLNVTELMLLMISSILSFLLGIPQLVKMVALHSFSAKHTLLVFLTFQSSQTENLSSGWVLNRNRATC